jgi:hypothetical protein
MKTWILAVNLSREKQTVCQLSLKYNIENCFKGYLDQNGTKYPPCPAALQVQRPGLVESVLLDVYLLRSLLGLLRQVGRVKQDVRRLADELGRGLVAELDYLQVDQGQERLWGMFGKHSPIFSICVILWWLQLLQFLNLNHLQCLNLATVGKCVWVLFRVC